MSSSESGSDTEDPKPHFPRLGECEVCGAKEAIYTCPKCEVKTCSLKCVTIHRKELNCDGIRDRTKFIRMKDFSDTDILSDYKLLEEGARFLYGIRRDEKKKFTRIDKDLPIHLYKLKMAARKRGIVLQFLAQNFTRHAVNTTRYQYKTNIINWRVEWVFPNAESNPVKFVDEKCPEQTRLSELLNKYLSPDAEPFEGSKALTYYKSVGFRGVKVLLRAEKVKGSCKKFFELDATESLAENLTGKCIVEFPIVFVVLKDHAYNFEIITPEDEFDYVQDEKTEVDNKEYETENKSKENITNGASSSQDVQKNSVPNGFSSGKRKRKQLLTEKIANQKMKEIEKEIKQDKKKKPKNLLFTTGYSSEESLDLSDDDEKKGQIE